MNQNTTPNAIVSALAGSFVRRAHQVIQLGHKQLTPKSLAKMDEPAVTGKLVDAIKAALDDNNAPKWSRHFLPVDDEPVTVGSKLGKYRPKIDITVYSTSGKPRPFFRFEAKRLNSSTHPTGIYLGEDGMLALIKGYYGTVEWAGMIGYVQSETCSDWAEKIKSAMKAAQRKYFVKNSVKFDELGKGKLDNTFYAVHAYKKQTCRISHTLLLAN